MAREIAEAALSVVVGAAVAIVFVAVADKVAVVALAAIAFGSAADAVHDAIVVIVVSSEVAVLGVVVVEGADSEVD